MTIGTNFPIEIEIWIRIKLDQIRTIWKFFFYELEIFKKKKEKKSNNRERERETNKHTHTHSHTCWLYRQPQQQSKAINWKNNQWKRKKAIKIDSKTKASIVWIFIFKKKMKLPSHRFHNYFIIINDNNNNIIIITSPFIIRENHIESKQHNPVATKYKRNERLFRWLLPSETSD